jgi:hypothetical protein
MRSTSSGSATSVAWAAGGAPVGADQLNGRAGGGLVDVGDGHCGTFGRKEAGGCAPDPRTCTRHDRDCVVEALHNQSVAS